MGLIIRRCFLSYKRCVGSLRAFFVIVGKSRLFARVILLFFRLRVIRVPLLQI